MIPIILAVSMKQDASVNNTLESIKKQALVLGQGIGVNLIPPSALTGLTAAQTQMGLLAQRSRETGKSLDEIRQQLNNVANTPGLSNQIDGYLRADAALKAIKSSSGDVLASNPLLSASFKTLADSAEEGLQRVEDRSRTLAGIAGNVALGFGGVATVFGGIATGALAVASNFESLQGRLIAVTGSASAAAEKFRFAQEQAAQSPFDLEGTVKATTILEGFQQKSEELLPVAASLAAALGKNLPEAALVLGKAASGSTEGFESLRNEYAITTADLIKFGAVQGQVAGTLSHLGKDIEANRNALVKIINLRYGDAVQRQAATLAGALSNVKDATQVAAAGFGQALVPLATSAARGLSLVLGLASAIPAPLKATAIAAVTVTAGFAFLGTAAASTVASFLLLQASLAGTVRQLSAMKIEAPLASSALQFLSTGATRVGAAFTASRVGVLAFGGVLTAVAAIGATVATSLIDSWQKAEEAMGDSITQASRDMATANQAFRAGIEGINRAGKSIGVTVGIVRGASNQVRLVGDALAKLPTAEVVNSFGLMTVSAEDLDKELKTVTTTALKNREVLEALAEAQERLRNAPADQATFETVQADLAKKGVKVDDREGVTSQLEAARELNKVDQANILIARRKRQAYDELVTPLKEAAEKSETLSKFLNVATQASTAKSLAIALADVNQQIDANSKLTKGAVGDVDALIAKLNDPKIVGNERALAEAHLKLVQQRNTILEAQTKQEDERRQAELDANELVFRKRKATQNLSLTTEIQFLQSQLALVKSGSEEEIKILEDIAQKKQQIRDKEEAAAKKAAEKQAKAAKDAFASVLQGANQGVADARAGFGSAPARATGSPYPLATKANAGVEPGVLNALELAKVKVDAWAAANGKLLKAYPEIQADLDKFRSQNAIDTQKAKAEQLKTTLDGLSQSIQTDLANSLNNTQRLAVVNAGLETLARSRRAGLVAEAGAQAQINQLTKQREGLEKAISAEVAQRAQQTANLELQNAEADLQVLQARKADGEKVDQDILKAQKAIFQQKLDLIEQEKAAAIQAANGEASAIEAIEKQAKLKREGLITQETLVRKQAADQQTQTVNQALGQQEQRYQLFADRIGGPNSPIQSIAEAFSSPGSFNLGKTFSLSEQLKKAGAQTTAGVNSYRNLQAQVQGEAKGPNAQAQEITRRVNEGERAGKQFGRDALSRANGFPSGEESGGSRIVNNFNIYGKFDPLDRREVEDAVTGVFEKLAQRKRMRGR